MEPAGFPRRPARCAPAPAARRRAGATAGVSLTPPMTRHGSARSPVKAWSMRETIRIALAGAAVPPAGRRRGWPSVPADLRTLVDRVAYGVDRLADGLADHRHDTDHVPRHAEGQGH